MTRSTLTQEQLSVEQLKHILTMLLLACELLTALKPILDGLIKDAEKKK